MAVVEALGTRRSAFAREPRALSIHDQPTRRLVRKHRSTRIRKLYRIGLLSNGA